LPRSSISETEISADTGKDSPVPVILLPAQGLFSFLKKVPMQKLLKKQIQKVPENRI